MDFEKAKREHIQKYDELIRELNSAIVFIEQCKTKMSSVSTKKDVLAFEEWATREYRKLKHIEFS